MHFLKEGTRYGNNFSADLEVHDGAGFKNVKMTPTDFEVLLQVIDCKI
jgi:hypothetical protein